MSNQNKPRRPLLSTDSKNCSWCRWFEVDGHLDDASSVHGQCMRFPPQPFRHEYIDDDGLKDHQWLSHFPDTSDENVCGCFEPADDEYVIRIREWMDYLRSESNAGGKS